MSELAAETQTVREREWSREQMETAPPAMPLWKLVQMSDRYSPDQVWLVFGEGASGRLQTYLNLLERKAAHAE